MKKHEALSVGQIIENALKRAGSDDEYARQQACYLWAEVVGPGVNRITTRRWVDRHTMHVCITSSVVKNELTYHRDQLVAAINSRVGTDVISDIVFH